IFEHLKTNNVKLGIITDGYKETQKQKIDSLCLKDIIDEIVITDELGKQYWKPHKLPFEVIVKKMSIDFDEMIYVGDNPTKDFYIGSIYPIRTVRILREGYYLDKEYFKGIKENYRITTLSELLNIIKAINRMEGE
ncbi:MAG: HAD-IA family hydrolase, partial [Firmicutes bacterium]|nr:HAD-IA family hydrolase [Bacillota bacterium]